MKHTLHNRREEYETLLAAANRYQREIDELISEHGQGVRPSWVSADIGWARSMRDKYIRKAETELKNIDRLKKELTNG